MIKSNPVIRNMVLFIVFSLQADTYNQYLSVILEVFVLFDTRHQAISVQMSGQNIIDIGDFSN